MINENFIFLAMAVNLIGTIVYFRDVVRGKARPNRITWGLWILPAFITFLAQLSEGVGMQSYITLSASLGPALIFVTSFFVESEPWKLTRRDYSLGAISLLALILWRITGEGLVAIVLAQLADFFAGLPTLIKSYTHPQSETAFTYVTCVLAGTIALLTVDEWTYEEYSFPAFMVLYCGSVAALILTGNRRRHAQNNAE